MAEKNRPTGVTIIAALYIIAGIIGLLFGAWMTLMRGAAIGSVLGPVGGFFAAFGMVVVLIGILYFIVAWGLLKGKGWARIVMQ